MSDPRPRPQYGEYATAEEVAALRGVPVEALAPPPPPPRRAVAPPAPTGARRFDRPVTIALLVFGLFNLIQSIPVYRDLPATLDVVVRDFRMGSYDLSGVEFGEAARIGGWVLIAISAVLLVAASWVSYRVLRAGRIAFWIPLVAVALYFAASFIVLLVVFYSTPSFVAAVL